jgi:SanA protein
VLDLIKNTLLLLSVIVKILFIVLLIAICIDLSFEISYLFVETWDEKNISNVKPHTVAIVPGAAVYGTRPSPILSDRLESALLLYKKKKVKKIILSGDNETKTYNELTPMLQYMLQNKVKKEDIFMDYYGLRTYDTLLRAKLIFAVDDAIIVTQRFHQPRAAFIAERLGIKVSCMEADQRTYKDRLKYRGREFLARNLAWIEVYFNKRPEKFEGKIFPISGNGEKTWKDRDLVPKTDRGNLGTEDF